MRAFICDACGKTYKPYSGLKKSEDNQMATKANGMTFVHIERDGKMHSKGKLELCVDCMSKLQNYIFTDLCIDPDTGEEGPFIEKVRYYEAKMKEREKSETDTVYSDEE